MSWEQFTIAILGQVFTWPVVFLVSLLILLKPIRSLINRIKFAKLHDNEIEFSELVSDAETNVSKAIAESTAKPIESVSEKDGKRLAFDPVRDPSGAIISSWESLVLDLESLNSKTGGVHGESHLSVPPIRELRARNVVTTSFANSVNNLRDIRNQVAHGLVSPTAGVARTYVERVDQLKNIIRGDSLG